MAEVEDVVAEYYDRIWSRFVLWWKGQKALALHYALYDRGARTFEKALLNMNDYVGKLLGLTQTQKMHVLDAGCGVGGTSIYLAKRYANVTFTGITIAPSQLNLAKKFARERNTGNTDFLLQSYMETDFPNHCFDSIFALESTVYARNKRAFVKEMSRILKPGGRFVVVDAFFSSSPNNAIMQKIHDLTCLGRGMPLQADLNLQDFISHLKNEGFTDITVENLTKNVARSQLRSCIIAAPYFFVFILKFICKRGNYDPATDPDFYAGSSILCGICGLSGASKYYAVRAVKNRDMVV